MDRALITAPGGALDNKKGRVGGVGGREVCLRESTKYLKGYCYLLTRSLFISLNTIQLQDEINLWLKLMYKNINKNKDDNNHKSGAQQIITSDKRTKKSNQFITQHYLKV